jgi:hypothetical protein
MNKYINKNTMLKIHLYESGEEEEIKSVIDKTQYDLIILENRPQDFNENEYRAILTKKKEPSYLEEDKWVLNILIKTKGHWQITSGRWWVETLIDEYTDFTGNDSISINGGSEWIISGMIDIIEEAIAKIEEYEITGTIPEEKEIENKNKDYSEMTKRELENLVDQALDNNDFDTLRKIKKYLPELLVSKYFDIINEKLNEEHELEANFGTWKHNPSHANKKDVEILFKVLQHRHPNTNEEELRKIAHEWIGLKIDESLNETKEEKKDISKILMGHNKPKKEAFKDIKKDEEFKPIPRWRFKEGYPFEDTEELSQDETDEKPDEEVTEAIKYENVDESPEESYIMPKLNEYVEDSTVNGDRKDEHKYFAGEDEPEVTVKDEKEEDAEKEEKKLKAELKKYHVEEGCCPPNPRPRPRRPIFRPRPHKLHEDFEMPSLLEKKHFITKADLEIKLMKDNEENDTNFNIRSAYGNWELWNDGDRLDVGSIRDIYNAWIRERFKEKHRKNKR